MIWNYIISLTFHYTKKKIYEKFRGPFEHEAPGLLNPPLTIGYVVDIGRSYPTDKLKTARDAVNSNDEVQLEFSRVFASAPSSGRDS